MKTCMYILPIGGTVIGGDLNEDLYVHTANRRNSYRRPVCTYRSSFRSPPITVPPIGSMYIQVFI
jgi:hypothetical protein